MLEFDSAVLIEVAYAELTDARHRFEIAVNADAWSEIGAAFMRFAAFSFLNHKMKWETLEEVAKMCSEDLMELNTYAEKQDQRIFGTTHNPFYIDICTDEY